MDSEKGIAGRIALCGAALHPFMQAPDAGFAGECGALGEAIAEADPGLAALLAEMSQACGGAFGNKSASCEEAGLELARERTRLYRALDPRGPKPPYEAEWAKPPATDALTAVGRAMREAGMEPPSTERCDYLGVELGFYQQLLLSEQQCEAERDGEGASAWRGRRQRFLDEHLGWFGGWYARYAAGQTGSAFFKAHLALVDAFIAGELSREGAGEPADAV